MLDNFEIEKHFALLRTLYLFIKSFINPFADISLTFSNSSSCLFLASTYLVLFKVFLLL